ncbi:MAG TPA: hypothetical protein VEZ44_10895 [bacterium]|nr:hypothetical protein [bacterium]
MTDPGRKHIARLVAAGAMVAVLAVGLWYVGRNGIPAGIVAPAGHAQISPGSAGGARGPTSVAPSLLVRRSGAATGVGAQGHGVAPAAATGVHSSTPRVHTAPNGPAASNPTRLPVSIHLTFPRHWRPTTYEIGPVKPQPPVRLVSPVPFGCAACPPAAADH